MAISWAASDSVYVHLNHHHKKATKELNTVNMVRKMIYALVIINEHHQCVLGHKRFFAMLHTHLEPRSVQHNQHIFKAAVRD